MSLHRRITAAAAFAVAAACLVFAPVGYLATRAKLIEEVRLELSRLAQPFLGAHASTHGTTARPSLNTQTATGGHGSRIPADGSSSHPGNGTGNGRGRGLRSVASDTDSDTGVCSFGLVNGDSGVDAALGGPTGYVQSVCPDGRVIARNGGTPQLPVTARVRAVARTLRGAYYFTAVVDRTRLEILVTPDVSDRKAIEVAVPLTTTDSALRSLAVTYALLVAGGIALAGLIGALIARAALAPIRHFTSQTERVAGSLDVPHRLAENGAIEIRRLAASFNQTLTALERSVEAQRHLIADASHELRTPIAALRSNIQIFLDADRLPPEDQAGLRDAIIAELDDLTQMVADVLELARGAMPDEHVDELELDVIVRDATERAIRRSPGLSFEIDIEPTVISNSADRVSRAVTNVIDNARKWSPANGIVEVQLHAGVLTVRDHGPGFRDDDLEHVFERFYRSADARRMPGSGLGLAIVKQAAEAHGGSVTATNASDGGAIVRVSFNAASPVAPPAYA